MKYIKSSYFIFAILLSLFSLPTKAQYLTVVLSNPVTVSNTQIKWDIMLQNTTATGSAGSGVLSIAAANLPQRTTSGSISPAVSMPLSIEVDPYFSDLSFAPQISVSGGQTLLRLNASGVPAVNPIVPSEVLTRLGTVTFNSLNNMNFPVTIGSTVAVPNVSVSGLYNGNITTFSLAMGNLLLQNSVQNDPITFQSILPIKLSSLVAFISGRNNTIQWVTSSEINSKYQIVETSKDGFSNWTEVDRVNSKNSKNGASYQILDKNPGTINYYRIHSIDFDGKEEFSHSIFVNRSSNNGVLHSIQPNPTINYVEIKIEPEYEDDIKYTIMDNSGKLLKTLVFRASEGGVNLHVLDVAEYLSGLYIVLIQGGGLNQTFKIIKQ